MMKPAKTIKILLISFLHFFIIILFNNFAFSQTKHIKSIKPKILFVITSHNEIPAKKVKTGFWLSELTHPYYEVLKSGMDADIVSINGGEAFIEPRSVNDSDEDNKKFMTEKSDYLKKTKSLKTVDPKVYKAIYFVGGHGGMWDFPNSKEVNSVSRSIYENGGFVGSVCHGPAALINIKLSNGKYLIAGKKVTGFSNEEEKAVKLDQSVPFLLEDELKKRGALYSKANNFSLNVVDDQRVVTGQNPASARGVAQKIVELIGN